MRAALLYCLKGVGMETRSGIRAIGRPKGGRPRQLLALALIILFLALSLPALAAPRARADDVRSFLAGKQAVEGDGVHHLGLQLAPEADYPRAELAPKLKTGQDLSAAVDLSAQLPPIGDQGNQGSCIGWSSTYYYKTWSEKQEHTGWNISDSRYDFSPSWTYNQINGGVDQGATFPDAFTLLQNKGAVDMAEFTYTDSNYTRQPTSAQFEAAKPYKIPSGWSSFWNQSTYGPFSNPNNISNAKAWLDQGKMLNMAIPIYNDFPNYGSSPARAYYNYDGSSGIGGGHGVCIVGYNDNANPGGADADHRGGFKMVNSWGYNWNGTNHGFVYLSYDFVKRYVWEAWSMGDLTGDGPSISGLNPGSGNVGTGVQINGNNFGTLRRSARVTFNGTNATQVSFTNARVTATVPTGATSGPVVVYDWDGAASNGVSFTVGGGPSGPSVTGISPDQGSNTGPLSVSVSGSGFVSGCGVKLSRSGYPDISGTGVSFVSSSRVDCAFNLSGASAGAWNVVVTNPDATSGTLSGGFTVTWPGDNDYEPNDSIGEAWGALAPDVSYSSFVASAGDDDYFYTDVPAGTSDMSVSLASVPPGCDYDLYVYDQYGVEVSSSINESNLDELIELPYPDAGRCYLQVYPYSGYSASDDYRLSFSYGGGSQPTPAISGVSPAYGPRGAVVTISGSGFGSSRGSSFASFGSRNCAASDYVSWGDAAILVKVPSGIGGQPVVTVTTGGGASNGVTFKVTPQISTMSPGWGYQGTWVTINGQGFGAWSSGSTVVSFGSQRAIKYRSWSNNKVVVQVPYGSTYGTVRVKVKTAGGTSAGKNFTIYHWY